MKDFILFFISWKRKFLILFSNMLFYIYKLLSSNKIDKTIYVTYISEIK